MVPDIKNNIRHIKLIQENFENSINTPKNENILKEKQTQICTRKKHPHN